MADLECFFEKNGLGPIGVNIYKLQNNKEGSKILLTFNMFNVFSLHNLGSILFLTNLEI
jgi:hypothetical protein